jgi:DNA integrity scanning protein DisA with diadenylate cyclase activity
VNEALQGREGRRKGRALPHFISSPLFPTPPLPFLLPPPLETLVHRLVIDLLKKLLSNMCGIFHLIFLECWYFVHNIIHHKTTQLHILYFVAFQKQWSMDSFDLQNKKKRVNYSLFLSCAIRATIGVYTYMYIGCVLLS